MPFYDRIDNGPLAVDNGSSSCALVVVVVVRQWSSCSTIAVETGWQSLPQHPWLIVVAVDLSLLVTVVVVVVVAVVVVDNGTMMAGCVVL
jgi:hypothetical protein